MTVARVIALEGGDQEVQQETNEIRRFRFSSSRPRPTVLQALDLTPVSRHLERFGDHATSIAEDVTFMVTSKDVVASAFRRKNRVPVRYTMVRV